MLLSAFSENKQREIKRQDGTSKMINWRDVILTDGLDTIMGETAENLTNLINAQDENVRLKMEVGAAYNCRINLSVVAYEKDGKSGKFLKATIHQMSPM